MKILSSFLLLLICGFVYGQTNLTNTGTLYVSNSPGVLYISGSFTNNSSASLTNNGQLYVKQNLTNHQASMAAGTGTLYLNGTALQTVDGTAPLKTFNLVTNNSAGVVLNVNLSVSGTHTFTAGNISSSSTPNYLIYEAGSDYSGAADNRHVTGWIKKYGNTDFIFPTGNGSYLRSISLINLSASSEFNVSYGGTTPNRTNLQSPLVSVAANENWSINKISGGTAQVQMNWDNSKVGFPNYAVADIRTAVYSGGLWTSTGGTASGSTGTTGTITSNALSSFLPMALGSTSFIIPLKFLSIEAVKDDGSVRVKWQTGNEVNVNYYEVERSNDGNSFSFIGMVHARNGELQNYDFKDENIPAGKLYYRVKGVDHDGTVRHSAIAAITSADYVKKLLLLTNPMKERIQILAHNFQPSLYSYQLLNAAGQSCQKGAFRCEGNSLITIPLQRIMAGHYILSVTGATEQFRFKLIVQ